MVFQFDTNCSGANLKEELARLEALRSDLLSLSLGNVPNLTTHADALLLETWSYTPCPARRLLGFTSKNPDIPEQFYLTSQIVCIDESEGWARSASRWYRLGERMDD